MTGKKIDNMASTRTRRREGLDGYLKLVRRFPLRPIRNEKELDQATAVVNSLLDRNDLDAAEEDYLAVLGDLVERYEDKHHPVPTDDLSAREMLEHLLEAKKVSPAEAARATGIAESTLVQVLSGKRHMTEAQIDKLARYFHVAPAVFLTSAMMKNKK